MTYIINLWKRSTSNGTSCIFRTDKRNEFEREKRRVLKKYGAYKNIARTTVYENRVIFSFCDNDEPFSNWLSMEYIKKPLAVRYDKIERGDVDAFGRRIQSNCR